MRLAWIALALIVCCAEVTHAQVTIRNFDGLGTAQANQVAKVDVNGNKILSGDEGTIIQWPGDPLFYMYTPDVSPGALVQINTGKWGGFGVYTSPDLIQWTPAGAYDGTHMFAPDSTWQTACYGANGVTNSFCWNPHPVFSPGLNKYILWSTNTGGLITTQCDTKVGPCGAPTIDATCGIGGAINEGGNPFIDDDATGYIVFTRLPGPAFETYTQQLNANYTACVGSPVLVHSASGGEEGVSMFRRGATYYVVTGLPNCAYCTPGAGTFYYTATTPLGSWSTGTRIDTANTCGGQSAYVSKLTIASVDTYLYTAWQWAPGTGGGLRNQSQSNQFWIPLTFSGAAINTFTCDTTFVVSGLTPAPIPTFGGTDQVNETAPSNSICDIAGSRQRAQIFTAGARAIPLSNLWVRLNQGNNECTSSSCPNPQAVNADLTVNLTSVSAGVPDTTLQTATLSRTNYSWSPIRQQITFPSATPLTQGTQYAIVLSSPSATIGCWGIMSADNSPYAGGGELLSTNGGSSWTPVTNTSFMFSTPGAIGGGLRRARGR